MKERLTGAIILVALIVVLVPELLSGPIRPALRARAPGSSAEEPPLRSYTISLSDEAHGGSGTAQPQPSAGAPSPMAPAESPAAALAQPATPAPAPPAATPQLAPAQPPTAALTERKPPAASTASPASSAAGWVVQLGSFANRSNAERLAAQVRALGYPVSVSRGTSGRRLYRVQAGPAHERAAAEQMAAKLGAQGHTGSVMPK